MPADQVHRRAWRRSWASSGSSEYIDRMPSRAVRRTAAARRHRARDGRRPRLLLFDDPTSGLDPITAKTVDDEIVKLRDVST